VTDYPDGTQELLDALPASAAEVAQATSLSPRRAGGLVGELKRRGIIEQASDGTWHVDEIPDALRDAPDLSDTPVADADPNPEDLTDREAFIARQLQTGATLDDLADELDERPSVVTQHLRDLRQQGWQVYVDSTADHVTIEGEHTLRSSEHKGTRTRKANRWWETTHNQLVRRWKGLDTSPVTPVAQPGNEDWVTHLTDLHAGDVVRDYGGEIVYETDRIPDVVEYITDQSLRLADKHNAAYDTAHLLYGGDLVTNEGIYQGQFEDLDAWLDEQADVVQRALIQQILTFAKRFETVNVVCQIGNHGINRASGTSRHNNADLLVYKAIRNFVAASQEQWGRLDNVSITIGEARAYTPFELRGGRLHGHLRHGQHRKPQAETSARLKEWLATLLDTVNSDWGAFDLAWIGHHHVSGRIPWNGPPIIVSGSPKPGGDYVEELGEKGATTTPTEIAHCHGVSDEGITSIWPIDTRHFDGLGERGA
jgi:DNA-binding CsgD family transcriptional regulator